VEKRITTSCEEETEACGRELARTLKPGSVVALYGGLGAGKTAFVRGLAQGLEVQEDVSSPTFTIVNEYPGRIPLFHFDMYRLRDERELFDIGWEDYLDRGGVCALEWSERVEAALGPDTLRVYLRSLGDDRREILIRTGGEASV
jgi:tRNA threonylcarbamoyladenosine biosynthesis protein TsaE